MLLVLKSTKLFLVYKVRESSGGCWWDLEGCYEDEQIVYDIVRQLDEDEVEVVVKVIVVDILVDKGSRGKSG